MIEIKCKSCETNIAIDLDQITPNMPCPACSRPLAIPELTPELEKHIEASLAKSNEPPPEDELDHEAAETMLEEPASKETMIWREKLAASFQAANISNIADKEEAEELLIQKDISVVEHLLEFVIEHLAITDLDKFERYLKLVCRMGRYAILTTGALFMARAVMSALDEGIPDPLVHGFVGLCVSVALYYVAAKFPREGWFEMKRTSLTINSTEIPYALGVTSFMLAISFAVLGAYSAVVNHELLGAVSNFVPAIALIHAGVFMISPVALNVRMSRTAVSPGEIGLGLVEYIIRVALLFSGALLAVIPVLAFSLLLMLLTKSNAANFKTVVFAVAVLALAPMVSYFSYLAYRIVLDFYNAVIQMSRTTTGKGGGKA